MTTYYSKLELNEMEIYTLSNLLDEHIKQQEEDFLSGRLRYRMDLDRLKGIKTRLIAGMSVNSMSLYDTDWAEGAVTLDTQELDANYVRANTA